MIQPAAQLGGEVGVDTWVKFGSRFAFGYAKRDGLSGSRSQEWERVKLYSRPGKATIIGVGLGANVLVGGSNQTVALQPVSVQGQVGVNLAVGFAELQLRFVH